MSGTPVPGHVGTRATGTKGQDTPPLGVSLPVLSPLRYRLELEGVGGKAWKGSDPAYRLRCLLKIGLRAFGLRCVRVEKIGEQLEDLRPQPPFSPYPTEQR